MSDSLREQELEPNKALISHAPATTQFNLRGPILKEVEEIIKAARSVSTPGPSGVPYLVYKHCPELLWNLCKFLKVIWRERERVADQFRCDEGVWIPKEENSKNNNQFRTTEC